MFQQMPYVVMNERSIIPLPYALPAHPGVCAGSALQIWSRASAFYSEHFDVMSLLLFDLFVQPPFPIYQGHLSHRSHRGEKRLDATILICLGQSGRDSAAITMITPMLYLSDH